MDSNLKILENVELFGRLSEEERKKISAYFIIQTIEKDAFLFRQGENRDAIYIIVEGELDLKDESLGFEKKLMTCGPGTVLGEPLLIEEGIYSLSGQTISECRIAVLTSGQIQKIKEKETRIYTDMILSMSRLLARRLSAANRGDRGILGEYVSGDTRREHDLLGERDVPRNSLWGVQTLRALENFNISGVKLDMFPEMIESLSIIKEACAIVNNRNKKLDDTTCGAIIQAAREVRNGRWHSHFPVDMIQGGAGTSTNMNANEVIANRALDILGHPMGSYDIIHPNIHVNMSQSTNDVYPSAIKLTLLVMCGELLTEIKLLVDSFESKAEQFKNIIKMGRTQLQDAVPMTLGQEFAAWAGIIQAGGERIHSALEYLRYLNMGGTAIGTAINTPDGYSDAVISELNQITGLDLKKAEDLVEGTQDTSSLVELAGVFKMLGIRLSKICNDLRLLSSGPRCGLNEINLPPMQPGSSIMPGKVNPVIPEVVNQVAFQVIGLDTAVAMASEGGQLELNVFEPVIAFNLFTSIKMLRNSMRVLRMKCIDGITANEDACRKMVQNSIGIVTALNPVLGYEKTSQIAKEATASGRSVYDLVLEKGLLSEEKLNEILSPENMV
ncbi:MAG: aspartate ammonia-lyase [Spirochaetia bacterium]|nr:aspartate ammonia-lyase [Spirochaetia bacterium]